MLSEYNLVDHGRQGTPTLHHAQFDQTFQISKPCRILGEQNQVISASGRIDSGAGALSCENDELNPENGLDPDLLVNG